MTADSSIVCANRSVARDERPFFFHEASPQPGEVVVLSEEESGHALKSLRLKPGDAVVLTDGKGSLSEGVIKGAARRRVEVDVVSTRIEDPPMEPEAWLAPALIRGPRFDFLIEKATELGARAICPLITARTEVRSRSDVKIDRWRRIAIAALKQSQRARLPEIFEPSGVREWIDRGDFDQIWVADLVRNEAPRREFSSPPGRVLLLIGPEGGWEEREREDFARRGASVISLGDNRLRAETAALALLVLARGSFGILGKGIPA
jgi:16S rRNA (uracil1498-N3)-methyltransferase